MSCIDFRRVILANPRQPDESQLAHARECAACRDYLERQREADAQLFEALQVPPPDGLADRILLAGGLRNTRWAWPLAASLVLAAGLAVVWPRLAGGDALGREAIAHLSHEPQALTIAQAVAHDFLPTLLADQGMKLARNIGQVTYSQICPLADKVARHLVVRTAQGPITLFLMPDDTLPRSRAVTEQDGMIAITLPAARGSITIVASRLEDAIALENSLRAT
ncbi:MAG TPA: DUF3379 family protein [Usitatibacter sp.]|nr:DUF3379 family protein [Usitatibacter sp.]